MPSTMSRTATREERIEKWVALNAISMLLSDIVGFISCEDTFEDLAAFQANLPDIDTLDAKLFSQLWPDDEGPGSPEHAEHALADIRSKIVVGQIFAMLARRPDELAGIAAQNFAHMHERLTLTAGSRPARRSWAVPPFVDSPKATRGGDDAESDHA